MKSKLYIAVVAAFILSACQALNFDNIVGQPIRFRATMADNGLTTRTIYSGEGDWSDGLFKERINWTTGDDVIVYMDWEQVSGVSAIPDPDANHYYYYNVSPTSPTNNGNPEYIHHGTLSAKDEQAGKSLTWKGDKDKNVIFNHYFYSVYPATCAAGGSAGINYKNPNDVSFTFTLPSNNADNMRYAYMAALAEAVQTNHTGKDGPSPYSGAIDLKYYPMITTLYVTLVNESNRAEGEITVSISPTEENKRNSRNPLYGKYTIKLDNNKGFDEYYKNEIFYDKETVAFDNDNAAYGTSSYTYVFNDETPSVEGKQYISIPFFVRPREYNEDIVLTVGNQDFPLNYNFEPFRKYNITVKLTGASPDEPDPSDPPTIFDISDGGAQMLVSLLKGLAENNWKDSKLAKYIEQYTNLDYNDFNNNYLNPLVWKEDLTAKDFFDIFNKTGENNLMALIQAILETETVIDCSYGKKNTSDIQESDFLLFKKITNLYLKAEDNVSIKIKGLNYLETLRVEKFDSLFVRDCPALETVSMPNCQNAQYIEFEKCNFTEFKCGVYDENGSFYSIATDHATFKFKHMPYLKTISIDKGELIKIYDCPMLSSITSESIPVKYLESEDDD